MSNQEQTNQEDLKNFKQLWQQSTTNQSIKLKEREMLREIQYDMDSFDEKFGLGTWKMITITGFSALFFLIIAMQEYMTRSGANMVFFALALMQSAFFLFHLGMKIESKNFSSDQLNDYIQLSLKRVERQILWLKIAPLFVMIVIVTLMFTHPSFQTSLSIQLFIIIVLFCGVVAIAIWQYRYRLMPLHNRLHDALFDIRNPYSSQNDEQH